MASPFPRDQSPGSPTEFHSYHSVDVAISFIVINTFATALRTCARHLQKTPWMWADVLMPISLVFNLGVCTCGLVAIRWGAGKNTMAEPEEEIVRFALLVNYGIAMVYLFAVTFSKLAILDLYLHVFIDRLSRYTTYATGLILILSLVANFVAVLAQCGRVSSLADLTIEGFCYDLKPQFTWASLPNTFTDLAMLILPIPAIIKLHISWRIKVGILITFLVGSLGLVTSILRFVQFLSYEWMRGFPDREWIDDVIISWTVVEPGVYHLTACLITLRPLLGWLFSESPLSSFASRSRLHFGSGSGSRSRSITKGPPSSTHQKTVDSSHPSHINRESDRDILIYQANGFSEYSTTGDDEVYRLDDVRGF